MTTSPPHVLPPRSPSPPDPPRRPRPRRGHGRRRIVSVLIGILLLAAAVYAQSLVPTAEQRNDPLTTNGVAGEVVRTDLFEARVDDVRAARTLRITGSPDAVVADDGLLFLAVKVSATAPKRAIKLTTAYLVTDDGLRFDTTERVKERLTLGYTWVQSGWWSTGSYFFEVPPSALAGARLSIVAGTPKLYDDQYAAEASIDLNLGPAEARRLIDAADEPMTVENR